MRHQTAGGGNAWNLTGNSGTKAGTNFIGTTDNTDLEFEINGQFAGLLDRGHLQTFFGYLAGANSTGARNTGIGCDALAANTTGVYNTALGLYALYDNNTGSENTGLGEAALVTNTIGSFNTGTGWGVLETNTTGSQNTAMGTYGLTSNMTGTYNTALGYDADVASGGLTNSTAIGANTSVSASNTMAFGKNAVVGWGFGAASPTATEVFIIGTSATNGNGAYLSAGGTWTNASTRDKKEDFSTLNSAEVLEKIGQLSISKWRYIGTNEYHIGPMAEDFYQLFSVGVNNRSISSVDPAGVALLGVQALKKENDALKDENTSLGKMLDDLTKRVDQLEKK